MILTNGEMFTKPLAVTFPCEGGVDLLSPPVAAPPGSLQECWNHEVSLESGYQLSEGIMNWAGRSFYANYGAYITSGFVTVGSPQTLFVGGTYRATGSGGSVDAEVKLLAKEGVIYYWQVLSGNKDVIESPFRLFPRRAVPANYYEFPAATLLNYTSTDDFRGKFALINSQIAANKDFRPPGIGPITTLFELKDVIYAARDLPSGEGAQLYRTTDLVDLGKAVEWEAVDMGYEVEFQNGRSAPFTLSDRRFLGLTPGQSQDRLDLTGTRARSVIYSQGQENQIAWQTIENVLDSETGDLTSSRGFVGLGAGVEPDQFKTTQALQITGFPIGEDQPDSAEVIGIRVRVRYEHLHTQQQPAFNNQKQARFLSCRLLNVGSTQNKADSTIRLASLSGVSGHGIRTETMGGTSDQWAASELTRERVFSSDFGVELVFAHAKGSNLADFWYGAFTKVYWVEVSVFFADATEKIYFRNVSTGTDLASAEISDYTLFEGSWQSGNAKGVMSLYNVVSPSAILDNSEIRTGPNGTGIRIGSTKGSATRALLPPSSEMEKENSFSQTIKANFFIDADREAIYGVTGAGPAFMYNGFYFHNIRTPIPKDKDKPRHLAEHEGHLVLAFNSGSALVSVVGQPTNFSGLEGASEWGFGDNIVGLVPLPGSALGVLCKQSSHALLGTTLDNFNTQTISKVSGAIEYSISNVGQPLYADFRGLTTIQATQQYGDFSAGRLSQRVTKLLHNRLQNSSRTPSATEALVTALPVRNKNQYRLYFKDGLIATMTLFGSDDSLPVFTFQKYGLDKVAPLEPISDYVPTAALSTVLSNGSEVLMIGTRSGDIYVLDQGTGILTSQGIEPYDASITFNPFTGGEPHSNIKYNEVVIHGLTSGGQELVTSAGVNYLAPDPLSTTDEIVMGSTKEGFSVDRVPQKKSTHLPNVTAGFSLKINSVANGNIPYNIQALTFRPTLLGDQSNGQKRYTGNADF